MTSKAAVAAWRERTAALLLVAALVALAAGVVLQPSTLQGPADSAPPARALRDAVEFENFSARRERSSEGARLSITLRLRTPFPEELPCYVFVVARNDQVAPKLWAIWPPQPPGPAITAAGHFHGAVPHTGHALTLTATWERLAATLPHPEGSRDFDTVVVYVVGADGRILLARPFRL